MLLNSVAINVIFWAKNLAGLWKLKSGINKMFCQVNQNKATEKKKTSYSATLPQPLFTHTRLKRKKGIERDRERKSPRNLIKTYLGYILLINQDGGLQSKLGFFSLIGFFFLNPLPEFNWSSFFVSGLIWLIWVLIEFCIFRFYSSRYILSLISCIYVCVYVLCISLNRLSVWNFNWDSCVYICVCVYAYYVLYVCMLYSLHLLIEIVGAWKS